MRLATKAEIHLRAEALLKWFRRVARDLPWRRTHDPYAIWVSEIMLQQTQVKTVIPYWERWMKALPDLQALARARPERLHKLWEGLGYYTRVRNLQKAAQQILERHGGKFPEQFEKVLDLPGVGRYTAGAICSIAFGQPRPILDGNVIRVLTRVYGLEGDPKGKALNERLWGLAEEWVKAAHGRHGELNEALMELGALVCLPRDPRCVECPLRKGCVAHRENRVAELPGIPRRALATPRWFAAFVVKRNGRYLAVQRPPGVVNGNLWEFPNIEFSSPSAAARKESRSCSARKSGRGQPHSKTLRERLMPGKARQLLECGCPLPLLKSLNPLCTIKHSITRYRITVEAYEADAASIPAEATKQGRWLTLADMEKLAFTSAHRRILRVLSSRV